MTLLPWNIVIQHTSANAAWFPGSLEETEHWFAYKFIELAPLLFFAILTSLEVIGQIWLLILFIT